MMVLLERCPKTADKHRHFFHAPFLLKMFGKRTKVFFKEKSFLEAYFLNKNGFFWRQHYNLINILRL